MELVGVRREVASITDATRPQRTNMAGMQDQSKFVPFGNSAGHVDKRATHRTATADVRDTCVASAQITVEELKNMTPPNLTRIDGKWRVALLHVADYAVELDLAGRASSRSWCCGPVSGEVSRIS